MALKGKTLLAYTAGIIDGEGCISICQHKNKTKRGFSYALTVSVWSTDEWLVQWLKMHYGGSVVPRKFEIQAKRRTIWKWSVYANKAKDFLQLILPYLYLKRPQAELAISFQNENRTLTKTEAQLAVLEAERLLLSKMKKGME